MPSFTPIYMKRFCKSISLYLLIACGTTLFATQTVMPVQLRCEYRESPLGLPTGTPLLSWQAASQTPQARDTAVGAWQVLAASSPELLAKDTGDLWDSGKQAGSDFSTHYAGKKLAAGQNAWWKVRLWNTADNVGPWSESARWSRGPKDVRTLKDLPAEWIGIDPTPEVLNARLREDQRLRANTRVLRWIQADAPESKTGALTAYFRKTFDLKPDDAVEKAVLWIYPDQRADIFVNGKQVGQALRWEPAQAIDITAFLKPGGNAIALKVKQDDGYKPAALGEAEIFLKDGKRIWIPTTKSWLFSMQEEAGWNQADFNAKGWNPPLRLPAAPWNSSMNAAWGYAPVLYLRDEFAVKPGLKRAMLSATAMGVYDVSLNGQRVSQDYFAPGWTDYSARIAVQTYDVTSLLKPGENAMGIRLVDGWFAGVIGHMGKRNCYDAYPRARASLLLEYDDGTTQNFGTSGNWKGSYDGPERYADLFMGSANDLRRAWPEWSKPGFDDSKWAGVAKGFGPIIPGGVPPVTKAVFEGAMLEGVRQEMTLSPVSVKALGEGRYLVDFGQNFVGWATLKTQGAPGQKITLRHGEMLNPDGNLYTSNLRGAGAADTFLLKGEGEETLEPQFTFHGFRYMEISGLTQPPKPGDITGHVMHSPLRQTGWFECSNPLLNKLFSNVLWGQRGNYLEVPTDCPQRDERLGWTGDVQFFARTAVYNFDSAAFLRRWLVSLAEDGQMADGTMAEITPKAPSRRWGTHTAWGGDAAIIVAYTLWQQYGDLDTVRRHFAALCKYVDWQEDTADDNLILHVGGFGDWVHKGGTAHPDVIDTAYFANNCAMMAEMAEALGDTQKAAHFHALGQRVKDAFVKAFVQPDGSLWKSSQTGYALAFTMDLLPEDKRALATQRFEESIRAFDDHLATGFIGTPRLIPGLFNAGLDQTAYRVLQQTTYPSWIYPITLGATTIWEHWDSWTPEKGFQDIKMNSFNHYAFGAVVESFYRYILGIDTDGIAFKKIVIRPHAGGGLTYAKGAYDSIQGRIESAWAWTAQGDFTLNVVIPANTTAEIYLPAKTPADATEGGKPLSAQARAADGYVTVPVGSGAYAFTVKAEGVSARAQR